jgi:hypothetical protein
MNKLIKLAFTVVLVLSAVVCNSQSILYEPVGPMDKPLPAFEIKIRKNETLIDHYRPHSFRYITFIKKKDFRKLRKYIKYKNTNDKYDPKFGYPYGTYRITYTNGNSVIEYVILPDESSKLFFEEHLKFSASNQYLYDILQRLILRL